MNTTPSTANGNQFNIRRGTEAYGDAELLLDLWASQISWLSTIGSHDQWGTRPIRETRPQAPGMMKDFVQRSDRNDDWNPEWCRVFIAETSTGAVTPEASVAAAAIVLEAKANEQARSVLPEQDEEDPFLYVMYLMSNRDAGPLGKGAGGALISFAKEQARALSCKRLCVHCWAGNDRKLVKYYESQGFRPLGDMLLGEQKWPGCVLEARVD